MRLNKKGFTLIELIITIVLMLSLTILVIVGFTNVSDKKKLEADKLTEKQIITAAEQYFSSNYYYVDYLKNDSKARVFVNLAKLVEDDYLNVTTKTSTEKKYNTCDIVFATYSKSGLELNYIPFEEIFDSSNSEKLGYETGSDLTYTEYLKYIGLEKKDDKNHACMAEVFTASDIAVDIKIDSSFTDSPTNVNSKNWYKKDIPLIVTISNKDNKANHKNEITSVDIKINNNTVTKTELPESTKYFKKYRIVASYNEINQVYASATTSGGKTANSSSRYYIDKEAPTIQMVAYKTNDTTITNSMPSLTSIPNADKINSDIWVNASGKKNVYLFIQVNDGYSGVSSDRFSCTRISADGADANKYTLSSDGKTYKKLYFYKNDKISTYECEGFDNAGNSSGKQTFTIKRDVTLPNVSLSSYKGKNSDIAAIEVTADVNQLIPSLATYDNNTWTNESVVLKVSKGDNLSGVKSVSCTDSRPTANTFSGWRRVMNNSEGTFTFNCSVSDNAGNTNTSSFTVKRDITLPSPEAISFKKCNYNSSNKKYSNCKEYEPGNWTNKYVKIEMDAKDDLSGVEEVCYATSGETTNYKCADTKVKADHLTPGIHAQGTSYIRFAIKDKAGNWYKNDTGSPLYTVKLDRIAPVIDKFENTKNTNCKTTTGKTCYYSHNLYLADNPPSGKSIDVSGLSGTFKYNHCYDNAESDGASGLICESGFTSTGKNKDEVLYTGGYANRSYSGSMAVQHYTYQYYTSGKYYNLFYKIYDKAGNYTCYRYKLHYNNNNKYSTALPTKVVQEVNCD